MEQTVTLEMILAEMQKMRMETNVRFERMEAQMNAGFASMNTRLDRIEGFVGDLHQRVTVLEKSSEGPRLV